MSTKERDRFVALAFCRADLLFELGDGGDVVFAAGAMAAILGRSDKELLGTPFLDLVTAEDRVLIRQMLAAASAKGRIDDVAARLDGHEGQAIPVAISGYRVPDFDNHFFLALKVEPAAVRRINPQNLKRDQDSGLLEQKSYGSTGAERALAFQRAGGTAQITMVKVDHLGALVEKLGASDRKRLMSTIGDVLKEHSLGGDTAGAIDTENFSFLHGDDIDAEDVNRKIEAAAKNAHPDGAEVTSRSATLDADGAGMDQDQVARAIIHTMQKFYAEDGNIRNESLSDVLAEMMTDTMETIAYIREVIESGAFDMAYMPICDLRGGKVQHFEALTRFRNTTLARSPHHVIGLAEQVGIITDLDLAICGKVIDFVTEINAKEPIPPVAVNISGFSIGNQEFVDRLLALLRKDALLPHRLLLEITETAKIDNLPEVNRTLQVFRDLGFKVCLDDFGGGAANFDYLSMLDVDIVKFDGPVVRRACTSAKGNDLLTTMAKMCQNMNILTVAEMVTDKKMANHVFYCGIDYGQGHYFGAATSDIFALADKFAATPVPEHA